MPSWAVRVWPDCGVPVVVGTTWLAGGSGATGMLTAEAADALPAALAPVTTTRTTWPMSPVVSV